MAETDRVVAPLEPAASKKEETVKLRPTLFIGVGGTGMEVMLRIRRRILNHVWGRSSPASLDDVADFPIAQFLHFDMDQGSVLDSGKAQSTDLMARRVMLDDDDKLVEQFDIERYTRSNNDLARYPHIESWFPLSPERIRDLGIDPSKGAGQIRGIGRLYFFDKYAKLKDRIRNKLTWLKTGLSKEAQLDRLGLELDPTKFRIVVIGSIAGGTGSGLFLDMGWLASWVAKETVNAYEIEMVLFLPTGYAGANKDRTEANGYAALMELETCMRPGGQANFVKQWDLFDHPKLSPLPFHEVYLVDSGNLAQLHTAKQQDVYDMVADAFFEDFTSADFANKKRSVAVNQRQHKVRLFNAAVPHNRYGDMKLSFYKGFSAFGQAILDTQVEAKFDVRAHSWVSAMLKAFFGVASADAGNRATIKQRDEFMATHMRLLRRPFSDFPDFSAKQVDLKLATGDFFDYAITDDLLTDEQSTDLAMVQQKVDSGLEFIATGFDRDEWPTQVRDAVKLLETDAVKDQNSTADVMEDRVSRRRKERFTEISGRVREQLYTSLDNKEFGGLEYVLSLVEQINAQLQNANTGVVHSLKANAARYQEIREALRTYEYERLLANLGQTKGIDLFSGKDRQAKAVLDQLKIEIGNYLKFHLRAKAAAEAADLMQDLSKWLGERIDVDAAGEARWSGLVGELHTGRQAVLAMLRDIDRQVSLLTADMKKDHTTYLRVDVAEREVPLPPPAQLREWADDAFKDFEGSRRIFPMLSDSKLRGALFTKLRHKAEAQMLLGSASALTGPDPLVEALKAMPVVERQRLFTDLLGRAMPWIDANLEREFRLIADQYRCYIGVGNAREWEQFREEIFSAAPTQAGITRQQISFVDAGTQGRAVCYTELSGIPLAVLRGLDTWRTSYRKEFEHIPVHTHKDSTKFTHPAVPTTDELSRLAEDFKTFVLGVMVRVLVRDPSARVPPGQYQFTIGRGDVRRMGNERAFRLNGLPDNFRQQICEAVQGRLDTLDKTQVGALASLAHVYAYGVYTPQLVADETGAEVASQGFASAVADELASDLKDRARRKGATDPELLHIEQACADRLSEWTDVVPDSDVDAYAWEVHESEQPRLKRAVKPKFFETGWLETSLLVRPGPPVDSRLLPPLVDGMPPLPLGPSPAQPTFQYYLGLQGQRSGPHPLAHVKHWIGTAQLAATVLAWRDGLADWIPLSHLPELAPLFAAPGPPPLPGSSPPPLPGPKAGS